MDRVVDALVLQLLARRDELELSQREVAKRAGIGHGHLSQIETGRVDPKLSTLRRLAGVLETDLICDTRLDTPGAAVV